MAGSLRPAASIVSMDNESCPLCLGTLCVSNSGADSEGAAVRTMATGAVDAARAALTVSGLRAGSGFRLSLSLAPCLGPVRDFAAHCSAAVAREKINARTSTPTVAISSSTALSASQVDAGTIQVDAGTIQVDACTIQVDGVTTAIPNAGRVTSAEEAVTAAAAVWPIMPPPGPSLPPHGELKDVLRLRLGELLPTALGLCRLQSVGGNDPSDSMAELLSLDLELSVRVSLRTLFSPNFFNFFLTTYLPYNFLSQME